MFPIEIWKIGIRELKWTGMGEFNSDYIYYYIILLHNIYYIISTTVGRNP